MIIIDYIVPFLVILSLLVFIHEMGHFWVARRCGVRVEVFSIGFGPELFGWNDRHGTRWRFAAVPLGGYVRFFGDADAASTPGAESTQMTPEERAVSFHHKSLRRRVAIVAAGPAANFLFAIVLAAGLYATVGQPHTPPVVGSVVEGGSAAAAGIEPGDRFVRLGGSRVERFEDIQRTVQLRPGEPLQTVIMRDGREIAMILTPERIEREDRFGNIHYFGQIGIQRTGIEVVRRDPATATWEGVKYTVTMTGTIIRVVGQMISGTRSVDELGGVVRIAHISGEVAQISIVAVVNFMILLSINLGLINLFPIPMLDGGHLLFYAAEWVRGRPLGPRAQEYGFRIGFALVVTLMLFATWNDLVHFQVVDFVKSLISS
jgi:regulator of sigma E protease